MIEEYANPVDVNGDDSRFADPLKHVRTTICLSYRTCQYASPKSPRGATPSCGSTDGFATGTQWNWKRRVSHSKDASLDLSGLRFADADGVRLLNLLVSDGALQQGLSTYLQLLLARPGD